jgi:hypothetical protein
MFSHGSEPPSAGSRAHRRGCGQGPARRGRAQGGRRRAEDRGNLERAAGWRTRALVLPDYRRRYRGRAAVAVILLPGMRPVRLRRPADARSAPGRSDFKLDPVSVLPAVFAQCPVRPDRNADGGTAVIDGDMSNVGSGSTRERASYRKPVRVM